MIEIIRRLLATHGKLSVPVGKVGDNDNLRDAGLSSFAAVQVMLGAEEAFDIEFPDELMSLDSFETIETIANVVEMIKAGSKAA